MIFLGTYILPSTEFFFYICIIFVTVSFITQIAFHTIINLKLTKAQAKFNKRLITAPPFVSIIIAAKNEAHNLSNFLPKVLEQSYPAFEVILVNDGSSDNTTEICSTLGKQFKNLRIIHLKKSNGKKRALTKGILAAKGDYLLFTDADCFPASPNWINGMIYQFSNKTDIVLGYGAYISQQDFLSEFIRYDSFFIATQYFYAAKIGKAYMGVGRNMAYKKLIWEKVKGFDQHLDIASGDDDLFIAAVANNNNTNICINKDAFTYSTPSPTLKDFLHQKTRHISTSTQYSAFAKTFSSIEMISRSIFYLTILCLLFSQAILLALSLALLRLLLVYLVGKKTRKLFNIHIYFYYFVLFDTFAPIFYLVVFLSNKFRFNNKEW